MKKAIRVEKIKTIIRATGTASPKEIQGLLRREGIEATQGRISNDIKEIRHDAGRWMSDTMRLSWQVKLRELYEFMANDLTQLRALRDRLIQDESVDLVKKAGKIAFMDQTIGQMIERLVNFQDDKILYSQLIEDIDQRWPEDIEQKIKGIHSEETNHQEATATQ